jgi:hypothetical protein
VAIAALRARTDEAIAALARLRADDPAAASAMQAVRLTIHTLRSFWLPAIDHRLDEQSKGTTARRIVPGT